MKRHARRLNRVNPLVCEVVNKTTSYLRQVDTKQLATMLDLQTKDSLGLGRRKSMSNMRQVKRLIILIAGVKLTIIRKYLM